MRCHSFLEYASHFFFVIHSFKSGSSYHASPSWFAENRLPCLNLFHSMSNLFSCYHVFASRTSGSAHIFRNVLTAATAHKTKQDVTPSRITSCFFFVFRSCSCFARPQCDTHKKKPSDFLFSQGNPNYIRH